MYRVDFFPFNLYNYLKIGVCLFFFIPRISYYNNDIAVYYSNYILSSFYQRRFKFPFRVFKKI